MMHTHHRRWSAMGTVFESFLCGDDDEHLEAVAAAVEDEVRRLEGVLSRFDPASEVSRINREAMETPVRLDVEMWRLLLTCEQYSQRTDRAFNIATRPGMVLHERTVHFPHPETRIDLGGIGKGYALDQAAEVLRNYDIRRALLNAGTSSVLALGQPPWPIDLRDPASDDRPPVGRIELGDRAVSCSAARRQGQAESDLIDPATGQAIIGDAGCVVLAPTATDAEVLSTALLVMGWTAAARYVEEERWPGVQVGWIENGRLAWLTGSTRLA